MNYTSSPVTDNRKKKGKRKERKKEKEKGRKKALGRIKLQENTLDCVGNILNDIIIILIWS